MSRELRISLTLRATGSDSSTELGRIHVEIRAGAVAVGYLPRRPPAPSAAAATLCWAMEFDLRLVLPRGGAELKHPSPPAGMRVLPRPIP